jgi:hypothetical protein
MVRRAIAGGVGIVLLIVIVLVVNGCLKSEKQQSLKTYNREVSTLGQEFETQVSRPLFTTLTGAASKSALDVEQQVDQLQAQAQALTAHAKGLSVPSEMASAQQNLLSALNLRVEGMNKTATLVPMLLGGKAKQTGPKLAGAMQTFLASDVLYSQRVAPFIQEAFAANGIHGLATAGSRFMPNLGWLETNTLLTRVGAPSSAGAQNGAVAPGSHGSQLLGVSVGSTALEAEPAVNHVSGGGNPTFTVNFANSGENPETDVKVDVTVTAAGKQYKASHVVNSTQPGMKYNVEIPVTGVPLGAPAKVEAYVEPVPGETSVENNKATFLAVFGE